MPKLLVWAHKLEYFGGKQHSNVCGSLGLMGLIIKLVFVLNNMDLPQLAEINPDTAFISFDFLSYEPHVFEVNMSFS